MKVLIDAMRDGIENDLIKHGYEAYSAGKLCEEGEKLQSDYSIMRYSQKNNMVLVTEDVDNVEGCRENGIDHIQFTQTQTLDYLLAELEKIKIKRESETSILISKERLHEGFEKCYEHVTSLLSDSRKLYESKELERKGFASSIALSILAYEEIGKLDLIRLHLRKNSDITKEDWSELSAFGSHSFKLLSFYLHALDDAKRLGKERYNSIIEEEKKKGSQIKFKTYEEIMENEASFKTSVKTFNSIKKACFYLDWKENDWFSIISFYSEHELKLLANFLLDFTGYGLLTERLDYKYPSNFFHLVPDEISIMKNDDIWKEREKYVNVVYTEEYQKFLSVINYLIDKFPK